MIPDLQAGQTIASHYILDRQLLANGSHATWIATHLETGERLCLRILPESTTDDDYDLIIKHLQNVRGLLHENIHLISGWVNDGHHKFLIERYIASAEAVDLDSDEAWNIFEQLIETLKYTHSLGIAHGHLTPNNLLVENSGKLAITGFGLPPVLYKLSPYHSPQIKAELERTLSAEVSADVSDDIYTLGHLLFRHLTGNPWQATSSTVAAASLEKPLPKELIRLLDKMLSSASFDRDIDLDELLTTLRQHFEGHQSGIAPISFSKQPAETTSTAVPPQASLPAGRSDRALPLRTVLSAGAALVIAAALLFLALPTSTPVVEVNNSISQLPSEAPAGSANTASGQPAPPALTPVELARLEFVQQESLSLAKEILRLQIDLEDQSISLWANAEYEQASLQLEAADTAYRESDFELALSHYQSVRETLKALTAQIPDVLSAQIAAGETALEAGDARAAMAAFTIATVLAPQDTVLAEKLERAENLDEVISLTNQAEMLERSGDLDAALSLVTQAGSIDPEWQATALAKKRLKDSIRLRDFQLAMSRGFRGIADRDYEQARAGFLQARSILPDSTEPADGLAQVEQAENNDRITQFRTEAETHASNENWTAAVAAYQSALAITPGLTFAVKGLAHAEARIALTQTIEKYLADPTLLQSDDELNAASSALRAASRIDNPSSRLTGYVDTLAKLISSARTQIPVTIHSNGQTQVTVRKHAELGTFASEVVYLIPGRYTIVGERKGYRDVREDLVILPGNLVPPVTIASTEKVR